MSTGTKTETGAGRKETRRLSEGIRTVQTTVLSRPNTQTNVVVVAYLTTFVGLVGAGRLLGRQHPHVVTRWDKIEIAGDQQRSGPASA